MRLFVAAFFAALAFFPAASAQTIQAKKIYSREAGAFVGAEALSAILMNAGRDGETVLLGEVHDNPAHHELQSALMMPVLGGGERKGAVVFEMADVGAQAAIEQFSAQWGGVNRTASGLRAVLKWDERGWPDWSMYEPLFAVALASSAKIVAGDAARAEFAAVAKGGLAALDDERVKAMALDAPLPPAEQAALVEEMYESHCRLAPRERLATMADAQRFRDAHIADRLLGHTGPRVLIAGNGHTRRSAVPRYLKARGVPADQIVSVVMVEVKEGVTDPLALLPRDANGEVDADFVIFTPAVKREGDPCDDMRRAMEKKPN